MARSLASNRIASARLQLLDGTVPTGVLPEPIERSWSRCISTGLPADMAMRIEPLPHQALSEICESNARLLHQAQPEMENLHAQIAGTQNMVILTDAQGTILHALGNPTFVSKAERVALQPGVSWREENTGTNAIGTALVEQTPVMVMGEEHYFARNAFLNCSAAPILDPYGKIIGVLDISGDHRQPQAHTLALVRMSAQMIENRLFTAEFPRDITLHFHTRPEFVGTLWEGIAVFSPVGKLLAINQNAQRLLGLNLHEPLTGTEFGTLFDSTLEALLDLQYRTGSRYQTLRTSQGNPLYAKIEADVPPSTRKPTGNNSAKNKLAESAVLEAPLDALNTGDPQLTRAISALKKIAGRDIAILIEGETGTGKELLAKAIHASGPRHKGPFVAINCASIPEGLIEAELFGYEDGAFTGAKRSGARGKIMQAHGGTLFLDEIGDMPMALQARLLRVLQERELTPLGSPKSLPVDIAVISATNHQLKSLVESSRFREDLYYRLNGLRIVLPPLRDRDDLSALAEQILDEESRTSVKLDRETLALFKRHPWPGNIRQLRNVLRTALAFIDDDAVVHPHHLPEDFLDELRTASTSDFSGLPQPSLPTAEGQLIRRAIAEHHGNITIAAKHLGISRATLYRKVKRLGIG